MAGENAQNLTAAYNLTASFIQVLIYLFILRGDLHSEVMFEIFNGFASE